MPKLLEIYMLPPAAIARLGGSSRPLDNYEWRTDPSIHGGAATVIEPATTLDVADDGSVAAFRPATIRFRDGKELRPVAPFFEIWARLQAGSDEAAAPREVPLTATLLRELGGSLGGLTYVVHAANRKAARRTGDQANAFEVTIEVHGDDHERKPLRAFTPPRPNQEPLVTPENPISLGAFQVIRPVRREQLDVDLDVLRARITPARGQVYGPPSAVEAQGTTSNRYFEIVPATNRTLNPRSTWTTYDADYSKFMNPEPSDTYDGADQDGNVAWGVVDDTCDGTIDVSLVIDGRRFQATSRFFIGPPDYAPDRRPFASLADDLADREGEPVQKEALRERATLDEAKASIADLFARVFETASLLNVDMIRLRAIRDNGDLPAVPGLPATDANSMTVTDVGYADDRVKSIEPNPANAMGRMQFTPLVQLAHAPLASEDGLLAFLTEQAARAKIMLRPAYGAFETLAASVGLDDAPRGDFRDPRIARDLAHDMRMPPYMRDETASALSLSRRQYLEVIALIDALAELRAAKPAPAISALVAGPPAASLSSQPEQSNLRKRVRAVLAQAKVRRSPGGP